MRKSRLMKFLAIGLATLLLMLVSTAAFGQDDASTDTEAEAAAEVVEAVDAGPSATELSVQINTTWVLVASMLVFFMQAGFAMLEAGFIRQTGVVNALLENFMDAGLTAIVFWAVGYGLAFGTSSGGLFGTSNFFLSDAIEYVDGAAVFVGDGLSVFALFFFQFAFAATASTIATGGMAERTDFIGDIVYSALVGAIIYPVVVHWVWGGGWLFERGFIDFAGSTVVHTVGGTVALIGAIMVGPRPNREFGKPPRPHNLSFATLGAMILWFGWYGFNPGSTLGMGNPGLVALIAVNTTMAAAAGTMAAMFFVFIRTGKWDLSFTLNGSLAGLVGITAGCASVAPWAAVVIGITGGILVVLVVDIIEAAKIDDAVGAFAVHGACGMMGTLAIGFIGQPELGANSLLLGGSAEQLVTQIIGVGATVLWVTVTSVLMFTVLKAVGRLRVNPKADEIGIDVYEHGTTVWPDVLPVEPMAGNAAVGD
ncbi:MAG: ammonium transporter [Anaerolineae bacterium]